MSTLWKHVRSNLPSLLLITLAALVIGACGRGSQESPTATPAAQENAAAQETPATQQALATQVVPSTPAPADEPAAQPATGATQRAGDLDPTERNGMYSAPPPMTIDPTKYYYATLKTDQGDIKIQLFADRAPESVNNFVFLAREGFYDNTSFHRVLEGFMAQAGDPTGTGTGGPGYTFPDEFYPGLEFDRPYLLAMANAGPATNGSQFFITFTPTPHLNNLHTIFGEVIEGQDVVDAITLRDPTANPATPGDLIRSIEIEESDASILPTPPPPPPTPTPFPPSALDATGRPLAALPLNEKADYFSAEPGMLIDTANTYTATIATSKGDLIMRLFDDDAPIAVNNFVTLANVGYYDSIPINQVNPNSLLVLGSPDGMSDAGYDLMPEIALPTAPLTGSVAYAPKSATVDGVVTSGSLLLLALAEPPAESAAQYSFFGQVVNGLEILPTLTQSDTIDSVMIEVATP